MQIGASVKAEGKVTELLQEAMGRPADSPAHQLAQTLLSQQETALTEQGLELGSQYQLSHAEQAQLAAETASNAISDQALGELARLLEQEHLTDISHYGNVREKITNSLGKETGNSAELLRMKEDVRGDGKFISKRKFDDLTIEVRKHGAVIIRGTPEVEAHLDQLDASASAIGDVLLFRENVRISEVLEETYHFMQNMNGLNDDKGEPLRSILNEIDAKEFLLKNASKYHIPRKEVETTKRQLESYQRQLSDYYERGN